MKKCDRLPEIDKITHISEKSNHSGVNKTLEVKLRVFKGEKMLCASNEEPGIFPQGRSWNSLMKNIREVIEAVQPCDRQPRKCQDFYREQRQKGYPDHKGVYQPDRRNAQAVTGQSRAFDEPGKALVACHYLNQALVQVSQQ